MTRVHPGFLAGGGELGELMRRFAWARSPLGPPEAWPQSLRSAASICLGTTFPIAIYWGGDLALLYNDAWSAIPGTKHPWALGRPAREVWPEIWETIGPLFEQVQRTGEGVWQQHQLLPMHRHGYTEECYFNFTFSPIRGEDGSVAGIFNAVVETTFQVIGERRERALRHLAETIAMARSEAEVLAQAAAASAAHAEDLPFCLLYRFDPATGLASLDEAAGAPAAAAGSVAATGDGAVAAFAGALRTGTMQVVEAPDPAVPLGQAAGPWPEPVTRAAVLPLAARGAGGGILGFMVAGISARRALDDDYAAFLRRAADHVAVGLSNARAYAEERQRAEALAELDRAKTLFFSNVSHEFRTPLTLIMGPLEDALADSGDGAPAGRQRERLDAALRNSRRLLRLVNTLLDFSRIEAGRAQASFHPEDLARLTAEIASGFRAAVEKAGLTLAIEAPALAAPVHVDRDLWEKVVLNLLSNAFRHTFEGGIRVTVAEAGDGAAVTVTDTGVGIPADQLPRLFDRFHRVEGQRSRTFEGSGIGLSLVRELVALHGGTIVAESEPGRGSTFRVALRYGTAHLPAAMVGTARADAGPREGADAYVGEAARWLPELPADADAAAGVPRDGRRILVADDNADMRDYLRQLLRPHWQVETVADGEAALAAIRRQPPDLVVTDVMMPNLDGFGLLRAIRGDPDLGALPVVMLSARAGEEARAGGLAASADDYLTKPFSARELLARVSGTLKLAALRRRFVQDLRESEARFREMADNAPVMIWMTRPDGFCTYLSRSWYAFTGVAEGGGLGLGWLAAVHPDDRGPAGAEFEAANAGRRGFRLEYRLRRADGAWRWAIDAASPRFHPDGSFLGYIGSVLDITERREAEERTELLLREVNHRSKNMLGLVLAVARQTAARSRAEFIERFAERIQALAASQDLLVGSSWRGIDVADLVRAQLGHFADAIGTRIVLHGPPVRLTASAGQTLGMALHELATNAGKYGALSDDAGRVEIAWRIAHGADGDRRFAMAWTERGGPPVRPPDRQGFGSSVIDGMLRPALGCGVWIDFAPEGLTWRIECEDDRALEDAGGPAAAIAAADPAPATRDRPRVLVVEDEALIAMEVVATLEDAGYQVVGPAGTVARALDLVERIGCDHAVLDVNLGRETAEPVALRLRALGVPFLSLSGYARAQQPPAFHGAPALSKPLRPKQLLEELARALAAG